MPSIAAPGGGRDPLQVLRHQCARTPDLAEHLPPLDGREIKSVGVGGRRGRLELCQADRHQENRRQGGADQNDLLPLPLSLQIGSLYIHDIVLGGLDSTCRAKSEDRLSGWHTGVCRADAGDEYCSILGRRFR